MSKKITNDMNNKPQSSAEQLVWDVFASREAEASAQFSRLRLENTIKAGPRRRPMQHMHVALKVSLFLCTLMLLGSWAGGLSVPSYDDAQQITVDLPEGWAPANYPFWVAIFSNQADELLQHGGHSLVVDYTQDERGGYHLELGLIGVNYQQANEWIREVMSNTPEVSATYSINQPIVRYRVRVAEMIAYRLGSTAAIERNVVRAWLSPGRESLQPKHIYLIAQPKDYAKRVSMIGY